MQRRVTVTLHGREVSRSRRQIGSNTDRKEESYGRSGEKECGAIHNQNGSGSSVSVRQNGPAHRKTKSGDENPHAIPSKVFGSRLDAPPRHHRGVNGITRQLEQIAAGDTEAADRLIELAYTELRQMAAQRIPPSGADQTLQPTALVHEAWLRLGGDQMHGWNNRAHFFAAAATAMRSILVDRARRRKAVRHGGGQERVALDAVDLAESSACDEQVLAVHEALEKFAREDPQKAELVKLRYFAGLSVEEAAQVLGVSAATVSRWWVYARAWLGREIKI